MQYNINTRGAHIWTSAASIVIANYTACTNAPPLFPPFPQFPPSTPPKTSRAPGCSLPSHQRGYQRVPSPLHQTGYPGAPSPSPTKEGYQEAPSPLPPKRGTRELPPPSHQRGYRYQGAPSPLPPKRGTRELPPLSHQRGYQRAPSPNFPGLISYQVLQYNIFTQSAVSPPFLLETLLGLTHKGQWCNTLLGNHTLVLSMDTSNRVVVSGDTCVFRMKCNIITTEDS